MLSADCYGLRLLERFTERWIRHDKLQDYGAVVMAMVVVVAVLVLEIMEHSSDCAALSL